MESWCRGGGSDGECGASAWARDEVRFDIEGKCVYEREDIGALIKTVRKLGKAGEVSVFR